MAFDRQLTFGLERAPMLDRLIESLEYAWLGSKELEGKTYPWVPFSTTQFMDGLSYCVAAKPDGKYLCVGSGIGSKLLLAALAGLDVTGIEIRQDYIDRSRILLGMGEVSANIQQADAINWNYSGYDFIYCYLPFVGDEDEIELEKHIAESADEFTVLFMPVTKYIHSAGWRQVQRDMWVR